MGVATTTDTTNSVRTSFGILKNLYGISVQVNETNKKKKEKCTQPEIIGWKMGSSLGPRFGSGLGSGSARARNYFSRLCLVLDRFRDLIEDG